MNRILTSILIGFLFLPLSFLSTLHSQTQPKGLKLDLQLVGNDEFVPYQMEYGVLDPRVGMGIAIGPAWYFGNGWSVDLHYSHVFYQEVFTSDATGGETSQLFPKNMIQLNGHYSLPLGQSNFGLRFGAGPGFRFGYRGHYYTETPYNLFRTDISPRLGYQLSTDLTWQAKPKLGLYFGFQFMDFGKSTVEFSPSRYYSTPPSYPLGPINNRTFQVRLGVTLF